MPSREAITAPSQAPQMLFEMDNLLLASEAALGHGPASVSWFARNYNTLVATSVVALLGCACGAVGSFMLLRKRALVGDALAHATLPGIAIAFMVMVQLGGAGNWLPGILLGAAVSGAIGVGTVLAIRHTTRVKEDAALAIVLSVFFGFGIALLSLIQKQPTGHAAGLMHFIYGQVATTRMADVVLVATSTAVALLGIGVLYKEFKLLAFDAGFARAQGWPAATLDWLLMALVTLVTVVGLQSVGLILMIALLVIPPAAARYWTERLGQMLILASVIGFLSGLGGALLSATFGDLPAGAVIVLFAAACFAVSFLFGTARGLTTRWLESARLNRRVARQNLLRAMYELCERDAGASEIELDQLRSVRSWSSRALNALVRRGVRQGDLVARGPQRFALTREGRAHARQTVRNHRLWELFLINYADVAVGQVDRNADRVEHVLDPSMMDTLERLLAAEHPELQAPASPHVIRRDGTTVLTESQ